MPLTLKCPGLLGVFPVSLFHAFIFTLPQHIIQRWPLLPHFNQTYCFPSFSSGWKLSVLCVLFLSHQILHLKTAAHPSKSLTSFGCWALQPGFYLGLRNISSLGRREKNNLPIYKMSLRHDLRRIEDPGHKQNCNYSQHCKSTLSKFTMKEISSTFHLHTWG